MRKTKDAPSLALTWVHRRIKVLEGELAGLQQRVAALEARPIGYVILNEPLQSPQFPVNPLQSPLVPVNPLYPVITGNTDGNQQ